MRHIHRTLSAATLLLVSAHPVLAGFTNPIASNTLWEFLEKILASVVYILFPIMVLMLVYTGYLFVAAQGNESKLREAKRAFLWTLIGAFVVLGAQALSFAIKATVESL